MGRRVIVRSLAETRAALTAARHFGRPLVLVSAPGAAATLGAAVFQAMVEDARREFPDVSLDAVLDCGMDAGFALQALRLGVPAVRLAAPAETLRRVADIARQGGARLDDDPAPALDLAQAADPAAALRAWLADDAATGA